jgi:hypothetical protein
MTTAARAHDRRTTGLRARWQGRGNGIRKNRELRRRRRYRRSIDVIERL